MHITGTLLMLGARTRGPKCAALKYFSAQNSSLFCNILLLWNTAHDLWAHAYLTETQAVDLVRGWDHKLFSAGDKVRNFAVESKVLV